MWIVDPVKRHFQLGHFSYEINFRLPFACFA
jgi:hypothetical protein